MHPLLPVRRRLRAAGAALYLLVASVGCASAPPLPAAGSVDADKFLFDRGSKALAEKKWLNAREYFRRLVDTYPGSPFRADAKLGIGDAYLGEGRSDSIVLAANEFREFLTFFPLSGRADYAQYKLAVAQMRQMLGPERDQTATKSALAELDRFLQGYPNSPLRPEVEKLRREARDRLSESEFRVGLFSYRSRNYGGAVARFTALLKDDPEYTFRDGAYFYLAETYLKALENPQTPAPMQEQIRKDAIALYEKLVAEFKTSEYLERANNRLAEFKR
ncbi:MAG TPA: outer membrane protein assembly factor BamD [Vicinamibacterales bacterium]|nr:outer membrane protein assembly factor BamD [Vicinamibacterales bacterium]